MRVAQSGLVSDSGCGAAKLRVSAGVSGVSGVSERLAACPGDGTGPMPGIIHSSVISCICPDRHLTEMVRADLETGPCEGVKVPVISGFVQSI